MGYKNDKIIKSRTNYKSRNIKTIKEWLHCAKKNLISQITRKRKLFSVARKVYNKITKRNKILKNINKPKKEYVIKNSYVKYNRL
jgi:hypothetical protein